MELIDRIMSMGEPWHMIILVVLVGSVAGLLGTISKQIRKYACHRRDIDLKRELVERGLSVDEIERIVAAKGTAASKESQG